jgi:aspartyl aminopeptidase
MHSIREMSGVEDVGYSIALFKTFYQNYSAINAKIHVD